MVFEYSKRNEKSFKDLCFKEVKMKTIKVIVKDHNNIYEKLYSYDTDNTFKDLFELFDIDGCYLDGQGSIFPKNGTSVLKYVIHNGRVEWIIPLEECTIEDYLKTYNLEEIRLYKPSEIGGVSLPEVEWNSILEALKQGKDFLEIILTLWELKKLIKEFKEKFVNYKRGCVPIDFIDSFIKKRQCWSKSELKMRLQLEEDKSAEVLLHSAGYIYDKETNLYYYNEVLSQKNKDNFIKCVNEYLENHEIKNIIK